MSGPDWVPIGPGPNFPNTSVLFMCPSPGHDLTHAPWPPLMCPDAFRHTPSLLDMPMSSQMHPMYPSHAPAQATTSRMHCGPLQCVPMHFNVPCPFLMCHHHPKHVPCIPHMPWPLPTSWPPNMSCVPFTHQQMVNGEDYVWPVNSLAFQPVCIARVYLCTAVTDPHTDTTCSRQGAGTE